MPASDAEIIRWQMKYLTEHADDLSEGEMRLLISFEDQFKRHDTLSMRQMEVLEDIYKRH
jgi:hypothetical protein